MSQSGSDKTEEVYTPLGRGRIVYHFPDGTYAVEFAHGGGKVFCPWELFRPGTQQVRSAQRDQESSN